MNGKRLALAALAIAVVAVALLAGGRVLRGVPGRIVADAIAPIATIDQSGTGSRREARPAADVAGSLPVPEPLDDSRVVDAMAPLARLSCRRDDPPDARTGDASADVDPLDAPLASWPADRESGGPLLAAAIAPLTPLPASQSTRLAEAKPEPAADCPALLRYDFNRLQTGEPQSLCQFRGKVLLVVNTASYCAYTNQYEGLEALYRRYKGRGLVVIGFPSNDFGGQEPGSNRQIAEFCRLTYGVQFPMFEKSSVTSVASNPLFATLSASTGVAPKWNFYKYVVDRRGKAVAAFRSDTPPSDGKLVRLLERLLAEHAPEG
jgi:glutathione peroxidase